jgi:hypothetical protein
LNDKSKPEEEDDRMLSGYLPHSIRIRVAKMASPSPGRSGKDAAEMEYAQFTDEWLKVEKEFAALEVGPAC